MPTAYSRLTQRFEKIALLNEASSVLQTDAVTVMPRGGAEVRGEQQAALAQIMHELLTAPELADDLLEAGQKDAPDEWATANLRLMRRDHKKASALPAELVVAQERAHAVCEMAWRDARKNSNFAEALPHLTQVIKLAQEEAVALSAATGLSLTDAMIDKWQPQVTSADIDPVFADYREFLKDALPKAEQKRAERPAPMLFGRSFPVAQQEELCRKLSASAGLDFEHARLDASAHPQCGGTPRDVRITTRYDERNPLGAIMAVMHETGHALYEQGLPNKYVRQPVGHAAGMALHESQSLFIEVQVCRSDEWLGWLGQQMQTAFGGDAAVYSAQNLAAHCRRVERSLIRVGSDALTYPAHVILRYGLEKALLSGDLKPADLPGAWNDGMKDLLGIVPPDDAQGCLQDIHWYVGLIGYFPSYTLGTMAAAQFMAAACKALPDIETSVARGDLVPLRAWLRTQIHSCGSLYSFNDLLRRVTGSPLDARYYKEYLTETYLN